MIEIKVDKDGVEDDEPPSSAWITQVVLATLKCAEFSAPCEVSVLVTNEEKIRQLNRDYRQIDKSTDVLSFALEEDDTVQLPPGAPRLLGDVIISLANIERQAREHSRSTCQECAWALSHGVLHLLGYDHQTDAQEQEMRTLEELTLGGLGKAALSW